MAGVWMDLWVAAALSIVAWLLHSLSGRPGLRAWLGRSWDDFGRGAWALRSKFGLLVVAWVALPAVGWTVAVMTLGADELGVALAGTPAADLCHERIDRLHVEAERGAQGLGKDERAALLSSRFPKNDGYGGTLEIDDDGFIACDLHGRSPNQPDALLQRSKPEELSLEAASELCHRYQQRVAGRVRGSGWNPLMMRHNPERIPEYIAEHFPQSDHYGGTLVVNDEGYVTCTVHGHPSYSTPVLFNAPKE